MRDLQNIWVTLLLKSRLSEANKCFFKLWLIAFHRKCLKFLVCIFFLWQVVVSACHRLCSWVVHAFRITREDSNVVFGLKHMCGTQSVSKWLRNGVTKYLSAAINVHSERPIAVPCITALCVMSAIFVVSRSANIPDTAQKSCAKGNKLTSNLLLYLRINWSWRRHPEKSYYYVILQLLAPRYLSSKTKGNCRNCIQC